MEFTLALEFTFSSYLFSLLFNKIPIVLFLDIAYNKNKEIYENTIRILLSHKRYLF